MANSPANQGSQESCKLPIEQRLKRDWTGSLDRTWTDQTEPGLSLKADFSHENFCNQTSIFPYMSCVDSSQTCIFHSKQLFTFESYWNGVSFDSRDAFLTTLENLLQYMLKRTDSLHTLFTQWQSLSWLWISSAFQQESHHVQIQIWLRRRLRKYLSKWEILPLEIDSFVKTNIYFYPKISASRAILRSITLGDDFYFTFESMKMDSKLHFRTHLKSWKESLSSQRKR